MDAWVETVRGRLGAAGYVLRENVQAEGRTFSLVARRTRFEPTKFGFAERFFVFEEFARPTTQDLREFGADAFRLAKKMRKVPLPCGLFESVYCFAVAVAREVDESVLASIRSLTPPKHWAAAEVPVVRDAARGVIAYFERTPLWGAAYYRGFREQIERFLSP